jgi:hypothetical protein
VITNKRISPVVCLWPVPDLCAGDKLFVLYKLRFFEE